MLDYALCRSIFILLFLLVLNVVDIPLQISQHGERDVSPWVFTVDFSSIPKPFIWTIGSVIP